METRPAKFFIVSEKPDGGIAIEIRCGAIIENKGRLMGICLTTNDGGPFAWWIYDIETGLTMDYTYSAPKSQEFARRIESIQLRFECDAALKKNADLIKRCTVAIKTMYDKCPSMRKQVYGEDGEKDAEKMVEKFW